MTIIDEKPGAKVSFSPKSFLVPGSGAVNGFTVLPINGVRQRILMSKGCVVAATKEDYEEFQKLASHGVLTEIKAAG